jgi:pimeloyl-ACP methyl ester carboxylesterase
VLIIFLKTKYRTSNSSLLETININIIQGEYDTIITQKQMLNKISEVTKPQKLYTIKDCGHMSFWEKQKDILHLMKQICT